MTHLTPDLKEVIGKGAEHCVSRSLMADRFVFMDEEMNEGKRVALDTFVTGGLARLRAMRKGWHTIVADRKAKPQDKAAAQRKLDKTAALDARTHEAELSTNHAEAWLNFLQTGFRVADDQILLGQLQARLLVNMAGSVVENAGLCLDRFSGLPMIPGSAVKGCARRMAIQQLLAKAVDDPGVASDEVAALLTDIALAFGWTDSEWKSNRKQKLQGDDVIKTDAYSDFWWAMATDTGNHSADPQRNVRWAEVSEKSAERLFKALCSKPRNPDKPLAPQLPNFAGAISFLPSWPLSVQAEGLPAGVPPELGRLELDVLTCHHGKYYAKEPGFDSAPDTEEPNPVVFPAVAAGHVFAFVVRPVRGERSSLSQPGKALHQLAMNWLREGLATFGVGAKTAAGYGWFEDSSPQLMPWWQLEMTVARLRLTHSGFVGYAPDQKDELVLALADQREVCRAWNRVDAASFKPIHDYAASQNIPLL